MQLLLAKYGANGWGMHDYILSRLFDSWYFILCDDDNALIIANSLNLDFEQFIEMLDFMLSKGIFNREMYDRYKILTTHEIQRTWLFGSTKKTAIRIINEFWLIDEREILNQRALENVVFSDINDATAEFFPEKTPQIKVKEIKEKKKNIEKKEHKENGGEAPPNPPLCVDDEFDDDVKEEKEKPKPQPGKQARKQAEKHRINQQAIEIIDYLNLKTGKKYRHSKAHMAVIAARLKEGFTPDDCKHVIDTKTAQWLNDEKEKYLRPETLFRPSKFEGYLNEKPPGTFQQQKRVNHITVSGDYSFEKRIEEMQRRKLRQEQQNNSNAPPQAQQPGG
jgi:uncharacterized phage protein (TIGR02220 family)